MIQKNQGFIEEIKKNLSIHTTDIESIKKNTTLTNTTISTNHQTSTSQIKSLTSDLKHSQINLTNAIEKVKKHTDCQISEKFGFFSDEIQVVKKMLSDYTDVVGVLRIN